MVGPVDLDGEGRGGRSRIAVADGHGIAAGDSLIEVNGLVVAGSKLSVFRSKLKAEPGQPVRSKFKRPNGEVYTVEILATPKSP